MSKLYAQLQIAATHARDGNLEAVNAAVASFWALPIESEESPNDFDHMEAISDMAWRIKWPDFIKHVIKSRPE